MWEVGAQEGSGGRPWRAGDSCRAVGGCLGWAEQGACGGECGLSLTFCGGQLGKEPGPQCQPLPEALEPQVRITQKHS